MKARENPFAMSRLEQVRFRLEGTTWDALVGRFEALGRRAALVGNHGSGKTTLAEELAAHWRKQGQRVRLIRLSAETRAFTGEESRENEIFKPGWLKAGDVVVLDGAEQLNWWNWRRFIGSTCGWAHCS